MCSVVMHEECFVLCGILTVSNLSGKTNVVNVYYVNKYIP